MENFLLSKTTFKAILLFAFILIIGMALFVWLDSHKLMNLEENKVILNLVKSFYPPIAILTSAILAGLGMYQSIHNTRLIDDKKIRMEKEKNLKISLSLISNFKHMINE